MNNNRAAPYSFIGLGWLLPLVAYGFIALSAGSIGTALFGGEDPGPGGATLIVLFAFGLGFLALVVGVLLNLVGTTMLGVSLLSKKAPATVADYFFVSFGALGALSVLALWLMV